MTAPDSSPAVRPQARLALDRYILGLWTDRDLAAFLTSAGAGSTELAPLQTARPVDRPRAAEELRARLFGTQRPNDAEKLEALLREAVDRVARGMSLLPELQHDLLAHAGAVPAEDPRARAVKVLSDFARASQVHVSVQSVGRLAEATVDRVAKAREVTLGELSRLLTPLPYLSPDR